MIRNWKIFFKPWLSSPSKTTIIKSTTKRNRRCDIGLPTDWKFGEKAFLTFQTEFMSPINVVNAVVSTSSPPLPFDGFDQIPNSVTIENNGQTVKVSFVCDERVTLSGGPLQNQYELHHIHFHWGATEDSGSEHQIGGKLYEAEMHVVFRNSKYGKFEFLNFCGPLNSQKKSVTY